MTHSSIALSDPPIHSYPLSIIQDDDQPSPFIVFPSSHFSKFTTLIPSPQIVYQVSDLVRDPFSQLNPVSMTQLLSQPSPVSRLLSSHCSTLVLIPSPHLVDHESGPFVVPPVH